MGGFAGSFGTRVGDLTSGRALDQALHTPQASAGEFEIRGVVWRIVLDHAQTEQLAAVLRVGGGTLAVAAGPGVWSIIGGALAAAGATIVTVDHLGGDQGVEIVGVLGTDGLVVTPRFKGLFAALAHAGEQAVAVRTMAEFVLEASNRVPAVSSALHTGVAGAIFGQVASGTPLGFAIAAGLGFALFGGDEPSPDQHGGVHADRGEALEWERFHLFWLGDDRVALLSWQGFFCAVNGGGGDVFANRPWVREWETWRMLRNPDGTVSFRAFGGHFLVAEEGGGRECRANRAEIGPWEKFWFVPQDNGQFALRTFVTGQFVSVQRDL